MENIIVVVYVEDLNRIIFIESEFLTKNNFNNEFGFTILGEL